jgi:hypothetical protein
VREGKWDLESNIMGGKIITLNSSGNNEGVAVLNKID